ncbi:MAG: carbon-nitrogen hydrolase family protein [Candidatus Diapherotrites archaeon]|nr:carbon-nitrogen hydrolase family protein [Candidatus Diapherotrites archaeon]
MKKPVIALAQIKYFETGASNIEKIKKYIKKAKKAKADIICFPETCVHRTKYLSPEHELIKEIRDECRKNSIWCIITEHLSIKKKDFNASILINREGKIKGIYKKINLYGDYVRAGKKIMVFNTDFAKIGIAICWDLAFPEIFQKMRKKGVEIVFSPSKWWYEPEAHNSNHKKNEIKILQALIFTRAYENRIYASVCNPVLKSKFQVSYSGIASPHKIVKEIIGKEGLINAEIDLKEMKKLRRIYET